MLDSLFFPSHIYLAMFYILWLFATGAIIASFLNVVIYRFEKKESIRDILFGRSKCDSCSRVLAPIDLIPIISFFFFKGKCRTCKSPIPFTYFMSELLLGTLYVAGNIYNITINHYILVTMLFFLSIYDYHYMKIPKIFVHSFLLIGIVGIFVMLFVGASVSDVLIPLFEGIIVALILLGLSKIKKSFGLGDVLVYLLIGFFGYPYQVSTTFLLSIIVGGLFSIILVSHSKSWLKKRIPFIPFIFIAYLLSFEFTKLLMEFIGI